MKIYVFGNPLVAEDAFPLKLLPDLKKIFPGIQFVVTDPNENFPTVGEKDLIILDTVRDLKKPTLMNLDDLQKINQSPISPHDYDLLFHLLLLKKRKIVDKVKIIGIPSMYDRTKMVQEVLRIISSLL